MRLSALELDVRDRLSRASSAADRHDRGVLVALLFSLAPLPPVALVGFVLAALNLRLIRRGKLPASERRLCLLSMGFAVGSFVVGGFIFLAIGLAVLRVWTLFPDVVTTLQNYLWRVTPHVGPSVHPVPGLRQI